MCVPKEKRKNKFIERRKFSSLSQDISLVTEVLRPKVGSSDKLNENFAENRSSLSGLGAVMEWRMTSITNVVNFRKTSIVNTANDRTGRRRKDVRFIVFFLTLKRTTTFRCFFSKRANRKNHRSNLFLDNNNDADFINAAHRKRNKIFDASRSDDLFINNVVSKPNSYSASESRWKWAVCFSRKSSGSVRLSRSINFLWSSTKLNDIHSFHWSTFFFSFQPTSFARKIWWFDFFVLIDICLMKIFVRATIIEKFIAQIGRALITQTIPVGEKQNKTRLIPDWNCFSWFSLPGSGQPNGWYPEYGNHCRSYYLCTEQRKTKMGDCPIGSKWNIQRLRCDDPRYLAPPCK